MIYKKIIKPIFFLIDPETIHHQVINLMAIGSKIKPIFSMVKNYCFIQDKSLQTKIGSLVLPNPIGLAAGFDKYIIAPLAYPMLGFGFAELGSITYNQQPGNPKPRLWRLPKDEALIVYYGLSNDGAKKTENRFFSKKFQHHIPYGLSIAPTTGLKLEEMSRDYLKTLAILEKYADYITLNVSCPNVANCEQFAQVNFIVELIKEVTQFCKKNKIKKEIFLKIGPHFEKKDLDKIVKAVIDNDITGIIATNLIKDRSCLKNVSSNEKELDHPGGISGRLLASYSDDIISYLYKKAGDKIKIIGVGGIFSAQDAYRKIRLGASAVQLITGFIFGGPLVIRKINKDLAVLLKNDGFTNISQAVGVDSK